MDPCSSTCVVQGSTVLFLFLFSRAGNSKWETDAIKLWDVGRETCAWVWSVKLAEKGRAWSRVQTCMEGISTRKNSMQETSGLTGSWFPLTGTCMTSQKEPQNRTWSPGTHLGSTIIPHVTLRKSLHISALLFPSPQDEVSCWSQKQCELSFLKERLRASMSTKECSNKS